MKDLTHKRCFNHSGREAVALCPGCGRSFCRECVTEHDDRMICASCLRKEFLPRHGKRFRFTPIVRAVQFLLGFLVLWIFFYYLGEALVSMPSSFHEGSVWKIGWMDYK